MANISIDAKRTHSFDAIVVGSGISGGWAAKELAEKGLKTLILERGRDVRHIIDYPTTNMMPWELKHRGQITEKIRRENPIVSRCYAFREDTTHFFVKDKEHPYIQEKPFDWIRGYQVGGKSIMWARQTQRWSDFDFEGPVRDGFAVDWPIRYRDIEEWYSYVEKFVGIAGFRDGLPHLPDGEFLPGFQLNCVENHFKQHVEAKYPGRNVISSRCAHLTQPQEIHAQQGRGMCMNRVLCERGCPFGGYFNSNSSTIPWALRTGNATLRPHSVVHSVIYDDRQEKVTGVRVVDAITKEITEFYASLIFLNAGALNTNLILLNSRSARFPNGLGNDNGLLGKFAAFHNYRARVFAEYGDYLDKATVGRRPTGGYIPRFRNVHTQETDFLRGYAAGFGAARSVTRDTEGVGESLKNSLLNPEWGNWRVSSYMMGETVPLESNNVSLDTDQTDEWGIPLLRVNIGYDDNDEKMVADYIEQISEMFDSAGFTNIRSVDDKRAPGLDIHEMGGVRMGRDPKTSLLDEWNRLHLAKNVFVTDGACMTSTGTQNPSLTYMALTARAADFALRQGPAA